MTAAFVYVILPALGMLAIIADEARRGRAANLDQHIEQAIAVVDDGRALADEAEDYLRGRVAE